MKTFIQYLQATDRCDEGITDFFLGRGHREKTPVTPPKPISQFDKWQAMRQKQSNLADFKGDQDQPVDDGEAKVMLAMRRSKKK